MLLEAAIDPVTHYPVLSTGTSNLNLLKVKREVPLLPLIPLPLRHLLRRRWNNRVWRPSARTELILWSFIKLFLQHPYLFLQRLLKLRFRISSQVDERRDERLLEERKTEAISHLSNFVCQFVWERGAVVGSEFFLPIGAVEPALVLIRIIEKVFAVEARRTVRKGTVQTLEVVRRSDDQETVVVVETVELLWVSDC